AEAGVRVRGYVSCVLGCPYDGEIAASQVADVARELHAMGCYEIFLGDTIGTGTPGATRTLFETVAQHIPRDQLAGHFHDTYGEALASIYAGLLEGIPVFDCSVAWLGGGPSAKAATGNVTTEDVLLFLNRLGIHPAIALDALTQAGIRLSAFLPRPTGSRLADS